MRGLGLLEVVGGLLLPLLLVHGKQVDEEGSATPETPEGDTGFLLKAWHLRGRPLYYNIPRDAWRTSYNTLQRSDNVFDPSEETVSLTSGHSARHPVTLRRLAPDAGTHIYPLPASRTSPTPVSRRNSDSFHSTARWRRQQQEPRRERYMSRLPFPGSMMPVETHPASWKSSNLGRGGSRKHPPPRGDLRRYPQRQAVVGPEWGWASRVVGGGAAALATLYLVGVAAAAITGASTGSPRPRHAHTLDAHLLVEAAERRWAAAEEGQEECLGPPWRCGGRLRTPAPRPSSHRPTRRPERPTEPPSAQPARG